MDNSKNNDTHGGGSWLGYVLVLIIGFAGGYVFALRNISEGPGLEGLDPDRRVDESGDAQESASSDPIVIASEAIQIKDQVAGNVVVIDRVFFDATGWVVIHEDDNGTPGRILGAQLFDPGEGKGEVNLLRNTLLDKTYFVMLHSDNGDRKFDHVIDLPIIKDEAPVVSTFQTLAAVPIRNESSQ